MHDSLRKKAITQASDAELYDEMARRNLLLELTLQLQVGKIEAMMLQQKNKLIPSLLGNYAQELPNALIPNGFPRIYEVPCDNPNNRSWVVRLPLVHPSYPVVPVESMEVPGTPGEELLKPFLTSAAANARNGKAKLILPS